MNHFEKALHDPSSMYKTPNQVLKDDTLTLEQKIKILRQWEYDARDIQVAEEENMIGDTPSMLHRVLVALRQLGVEIDPEKSSTTKQGGSSAE
jgi:hypothetical protein